MTNPSELAARLRDRIADNNDLREVLYLLAEAADTIDRLTSKGEAVAWAWELQLNGHGLTHTHFASEKPVFSPHDATLVRNLRPLYASPREVPVEPTHWAVSSPTGMHVGLWSDRMLARQVLEGYPPGYTITPFAALPHNQGETKP